VQLKHEAPKLKPQFQLKKKKTSWVSVAHTCNLATQEAEIRKIIEVQSQPSPREGAEVGRGGEEKGRINKTRYGKGNLQLLAGVFMTWYHEQEAPRNISS
jgi:hypothetical protein